MLIIQLKKIDYNTKVTEIENKLNNHNHDKYIDTQEFNKLAADVFNARIAQANLIIKNIYIVYELGASGANDSDPTLKNGLFGAVTLTKNADIGRSAYSGYGIGFDRRSSFSFSGGGFGQNILIFGVDMSSSTHIDNKKTDILVLGKGPTQDT